MKTLTLLFTLLASMSFGQELIFNSGFEPNTDTNGQGSLSTDLIGVDNSVSPPNDWVNDLEGHMNIGTFSLQYEGGDDTMRIAQIIPDPLDPANNVCEFWLKYPNVGAQEKGRVQANINGNTDLYEIYYKIKLMIHPDLDTLNDIWAKISWFTLAEYWNNPGWIDPTHGFRITVNMQKDTLPGTQDLHFGVHGQIYDTINQTYGNMTIWEYEATHFSIPSGEWMELEYYLKEGDSLNGRFYMAITTDGGPKTVLFDVTETTHNPYDPDPDGFTHTNPWKLYTSPELIDTLRAWDKELAVYWDDFELWKDLDPLSILPPEPPYYVKRLYPNPATNGFTVSLPAFHSNVKIGVYGINGSLVQEEYYEDGQQFNFELSQALTGQFIVLVSANEAIYREIVIFQ